MKFIDNVLYWFQSRYSSNFLFYRQTHLEKFFPENLDIKFENQIKMQYHASFLISMSVRRFKLSIFIVNYLNFSPVIHFLTDFQFLLKLILKNQGVTN